MALNFSIHRVSWETHSDSLSAIRTTVFVEEQNVPANLEWDEHDSTCLHLLATTLVTTTKATIETTIETKNGTLETGIGTARMLNNGHIGRMAVLADYRKMGVGNALLTELIKIADSRKLDSVFLHAQISAVGFYEKAGFRAYGKQFMDAGIPHLSMNLKLSSYT